MGHRALRYTLHMRSERNAELHAVPKFTNHVTKYDITTLQFAFSHAPRRTIYEVLATYVHVEGAM